jgi:hypothetical protein
MEVPTVVRQRPSFPFFSERKLKVEVKKERMSQTALVSALTMVKAMSVHINNEDIAEEFCKAVSALILVPSIGIVIVLAFVAFIIVVVAVVVVVFAFIIIIFLCIDQKKILIHGSLIPLNCNTYLTLINRYTRT